MTESLQKEEELTVPDDLLTNLERDFNEAMGALEGEASLGHFRLEYEKLYRALKKSHESEKQLVQQCQEMTQELLGNAAKMQAAVKLSQGDHSTIEALKKETEKAWKTVDSANDKDFRARETVKTLKQEVATLQGMIEEGTAFSKDHTKTLEELKLDNKRLQVENDEMSKQIETLSREMADNTTTAQRAEADMKAHEEELERLGNRYEMVNQEYRRERNARERADYQCKDLLVVLRTRENEAATSEARETAVTATLTRLKEKISEAQERKRALTQKLETAERQLYHAQQSYNDSVDTTADLNERLRATEQQVNLAERQSAKAKDETERVHRVRDSDFKELGRLKQQVDNIRRDKENVERQREQVTRRIASLQSEKASLVEAHQLVDRECASLGKKSDAETARKTEVEDYIKAESVSQKEVEESIEREREIQNRLKAQLQRLEKDREKCVVDVSQVTSQHASAQEELKMTTLTVEEVQKQIDECENTLNVQQNKYEKVRAERNQFSRKLVETQDEIVELKQRFKVMDHQLHQFKEELRMKEKKLQEEASKQKSAKERLTKARKDVNDRTSAFDDAKAKSDTVAQQIRQLVKVVDTCDKELSEQQKTFLQVSAERDLLGTQLVRRNDELALLYEKLRLQQDTLNRGEVALSARQDDLRLLRLKTNEISRQAQITNVRVHDMQDAKARVQAMQRELAVEHAKVAAMSEQLQNPNNESRWRKMDGHDPSPAELADKQRDLQKRLINKSEECLEKEMTLQEKNRLVAEMHTLLAQQPGPQVAQQLNVFNKDLQKKNARMKQKASELNMTSTHISELKYEAERLRRELRDTKRKYYEVKVNNDELLHESLSPGGVDSAP